MDLQIKDALEEDVLLERCHLDQLRRVGSEALVIQPGQSTHFRQAGGNLW